MIDKIIDLEQQPNDDCVSRANLISKLEILDRIYGSDFYWETRKIVDKLQSVTPQPKTGHWIFHYDVYSKVGWYECDRCHTERAFNTDYCPDCGAKMVKVESEE
jgi:hypothetical protein